MGRKTDLVGTGTFILVTTLWEFACKDVWHCWDVESLVDRNDAANKNGTRK